MISNNLSDTFSDTFSFPILYSSPKERKTIIRHPSPHSLTQNYFSPSNLQNKVVLYLFHFLFLFLSWRPLLFLVFFILSHHKWKSDLQKKLVLLSRPNAVKKRQGRAGSLAYKVVGYFSLYLLSLSKNRNTTSKQSSIQPSTLLLKTIKWIQYSELTFSFKVLQFKEIFTVLILQGIYKY